MQDRMYNEPRLVLLPGYSIVQGPQTSMVRPHPAVWRLVHGITMVYMLGLVWLLFQTRDDARVFLRVSRNTSDASVDVRSPASPGHDLLRHVSALLRQQATPTQRCTTFYITHFTECSRARVVVDSCIPRYHADIMSMPCTFESAHQPAASPVTNSGAPHQPFITLRLICCAAVLCSICPLGWVSR